MALQQSPVHCCSCMKLAAQLGLEGSPVLHSTNVPSSAPINSLCQKSMVSRFYSIGINWCIAFCANTACTRGCWPTDLSVFFKDDDIDSDRPLRMKTSIPTLSTDCLWQCRRKLSINGKKNACITLLTVLLYKLTRSHVV